MSLRRKLRKNRKNYLNEIIESCPQKMNTSSPVSIRTPENSDNGRLSQTNLMLGF